MATMTAAQCRELWADLMAELSARREAVGLTKEDLRAALDAADQWASDNAALYNLALPLPARTVLTASQKARLLAVVLLRRYEKGVS